MTGWVNSGRDLQLNATMDATGYQEYSHNQQKAHNFTFSALEGVVRELDLTKGLRVLDLGCADGSNSVLLLRKLFGMLTSRLSDLPVKLLNVELIMNEHPCSNFDAIAKAIDKEYGSHGSPVGEGVRVFPSIIPRSFYQPVIAPGTVDVSLSYICAHWLDQDAEDWHALEEASIAASADWTQANEHLLKGTALLQRWRAKAEADLVRFLRRRAAEMKTGAHGVYLFVGGDSKHELHAPADGGPGPLTRAVAKAAERLHSGDTASSLRRHVLVPYFLRSVADVKQACSAVSDAFELLEVQDNEIVAEDAQGTAAMLWSIHQHSVQVGAQRVLQADQAAVERFVEACREDFISAYLEVYAEAPLRLGYVYMHVRRVN